uniref:Uncharacterized protein n=1 Tax=uncultured bacterium contig00266 TaxID=1181616 RepID=A0A806K1S0_9BACT|nr:hypothetical protein [uncultured bacterium contig00266]
MFSERTRNFEGIVWSTLIGVSSDELLTDADELLERLEEDAATEELLERLEDETATEELLERLEDEPAGQGTS